MKVEISYYKSQQDGNLHHARVKIDNERNYIVRKMEVNIPLIAEYGCGCGSGYDHKPAFFLSGECKDFKYDQDKKSIRIF